MDFCSSVLEPFFFILRAALIAERAKVGFINRLFRPVIQIRVEEFLFESQHKKNRAYIFFHVIFAP